MAEKLGKNIPADRPIGESWEISAWGDNQTKVSTGEFAGTALGELFNRDPSGLVGKAGRNQKGFPLLFKFIDAQENLSIQVHPSGQQARAHGWGNRGKTECWYVVDACEGAQIAAGFNRNNVTQTEAEQAIKMGSFESLVNFMPVKAGDVFFIPAGTVHALLKGVLIYEVQEESDTTLRLYDWNRKTPEGEIRELHIDKALEIINFTENRPLKPTPIMLEQTAKYTYESRCDNPKFFLGEYKFTGQTVAALDSVDGFRVISVIAGSASLTAGNSSVILDKGQTVLVPALLSDVKLEGEAGTNVLVTMRNK